MDAVTVPPACEGRHYFTKTERSGFRCLRCGDRPETPEVGGQMEFPMAVQTAITMPVYA